MQIVVYMPWPLYVTDLTYITGFSCMLTHLSPQVLDDVSQLLALAYHDVPASVMLTDCIQQVCIPLLVWHSETGCSDSYAEANSIPTWCLSE